VIDLRTDTITRPTAAMRAAIAAAEVGDEQKGEDPTTAALERRIAELLGHEEAVFVPSATMANQIAVQLLIGPGDELLADSASHVLQSEAGGAAALAGALVVGLETADGCFSADGLCGAIARRHLTEPVERLVWVENTHSNGGGTAWQTEQLDELIAAARELGCRLHLDGARILNAAIAVEVEPKRLSAPFDTATICLSKGLGCPAGAAVACSAALAPRTRLLKQRLGGAMRQSGILAAAGVYALDHHVERLAEDHANAAMLAGMLADAGVAVSPEAVSTNFVLIDVERMGLAPSTAIERCREPGVLVSPTAAPGSIRAVTHLDVDSAAVEAAAGRIAEALAGP
jgi:threonine aldolase